MASYKLALELSHTELKPYSVFPTREVRDADTAGREELVVSPSLFIGRRGLAAARASGKAAGGGEPAEGATGGGRPWSSPEAEQKRPTSKAANNEWLQRSPWVL